MKKTFTVILSLLFLMLSACSVGEQGKTIQGEVKIYTEDTTVLSEMVTTSKNNAEDVLIEACQKQKIPYTLESNLFDNFGGIASTKTDGWILFVNGEVAQTGAYQVMLEDGFLVEFQYVNYDTIFGE